MRFNVELVEVGYVEVTDGHLFLRVAYALEAAPWPYRLYVAATTLYELHPEVEPYLHSCGNVEGYRTMSEVVKEVGRIMRRLAPMESGRVMAKVRGLLCD